jgi:DNA-binding transcriptional ArsR family regulator
MASTPVLEVDDLSTFRVLDNPLRLRILRALDEPLSVASLAEELEVPVTRLYYHVNLLVEAGILEVADTRKVGAMTEKLYRRLADSFRPGRGLLEKGHEPDEVARVMASLVLDSARADAESALTDHFKRLASGGTGSMEGGLIRTMARLTPEGITRMKEELQRLAELMEELDEKKGGTEYAFTVTLFPVVGQGVYAS